MRSKDVHKNLTLNAIINLKESYRDIEGGRPNPAAVKVYTAIELVLKARLVLEHWSLIVSRTADLDEFESGNFNSVAFDEACTRLSKAVKAPVPLKAEKVFTALRERRNKIVHFYTPDMTDGYSREQPEEKPSTKSLVQKARDELLDLVTKTWQPHFDAFKGKFEKLSGATLTTAPDYDALRRCPGISAPLGGAHAGRVPRQGPL